MPYDMPNAEIGLFEAMYSARAMRWLKSDPADYRKLSQPAIFAPCEPRALGVLRGQPRSKNPISHQAASA